MSFEFGVSTDCSLAIFHKFTKLSPAIAATSSSCQRRYFHVLLAYCRSPSLLCCPQLANFEKTSHIFKRIPSDLSWNRRHVASSLHHPYTAPTMSEKNLADAPIEKPSFLSFLKKNQDKQDGRGKRKQNGARSDESSACKSATVSFSSACRCFFFVSPRCTYTRAQISIPHPTYSCITYCLMQIGQKPKTRRKCPFLSEQARHRVSSVRHAASAAVFISGGARGSGVDLWLEPPMICHGGRATAQPPRPSRQR